MAVAVVELARLGLRQHLVRLDDLAEALLGVGRVGDVGVQLARERAERLLDLRLGRVARDAEQLVVVAFGRRHRAASTLARRSLRRSATARTRRSGRHGSPSRSPCAPGRQADGAERAVHEPVAGADERDLVERGVRRARGRRGRTAGAARAPIAEHVEQRAARCSTSSNRLPVRVELVAAHLAEQAGGAADVQPLLGVDDLRERRRERGEERALARAEARILEAAAQQRRAELRGPTTVSFRYSPAHFASPGRPARRSANTRFVTPPVDVITTTITSCGWSSSTSTCTTVVAWSGGADTSASSRVTCESISVVACSADSTSAARVGAGRAGSSAAAARWRSSRLVGVDSGSRARSARGPPTCADA